MVPLGEVLSERCEVPAEDAVAAGDVRIVAKIGFNDGRIVLREGSETKTGMILIRPGDLVLSGINAAKGAIAIYGDENTEPVAATIHYGAYCPTQGKVDVRYLWWLLRSQVFRDLLLRYVPGGIKTELKAKRFLPIPVPMPPLVEQRRIVARIEELAARIEEARTLRDLARAECLALGSSVLAGAISANAGVEPLVNLLAEGRTISYGVLVPGPEVPDGVPFVRVQDLNPRCPTEQPAKRISPSVDAQYRRTRLEGDEVLVGVVGSIGKIGIVPDTWKGANIARAVCRIVPGSRLRKDYLVAVLQSSPVQAYFRETTRTLAQPTLNVRQLEQTPIPVPSLPEQRRIVAYLDDLQTKVDGLKQLQAQTAAELAALLPSILDKAFKGEL